MTHKEVEIPILDCGANGLNLSDEIIQDEDIKSLGEKIKMAFASAGFCYLRNHGIEKNLIERYMQVSRQFFEQPVEIKQNYLHSKDKIFGWVAVGREQVNPNRPNDLKEAFNYFPPGDNYQWPDTEDFQKYSKLMFDACASLTKRLFDCLSVGLGLEKSFMSDAHTYLGRRDNPSVLRTLYYPPIVDDSLIKPGQIRLGEHSDYGTITLLFQDDIGGLEANIPGQGFVPVTPVPDTVVVNIGDLMQRWSADTLIATKHRVLIPEAEMKKRKPRQSVAFFVHPDNDYIISPLDGSNKYKPVSSIDYLQERLNATY